MPDEQSGFQHQDPVRPSDQASESAPERDALHYATADDSATREHALRVSIKELNGAHQNGRRTLISRLVSPRVIAGGALAAVTAIMLRKRR